MELLQEFERLNWIVEAKPVAAAALGFVTSAEYVHFPIDFGVADIQHLPQKLCLTRREPEHLFVRWHC